MNLPKFFIGPVSQNVVNACIEFVNETDLTLGMCASQNQVDAQSGYSGFTTETLTKHVRGKTNKILICRDHGTDLECLKNDISHRFDILHLDPWKLNQNFKEATKLTIEMMRACLEVNPEQKFEVGTEEAVSNISANKLKRLLYELKDLDLLKHVVYAVIQDGTKISGNRNVGAFDGTRCSWMVQVCNQLGVSSKVHNGDYLELPELKERFKRGVTSVNIAPEFGRIESAYFASKLNKKQYNRFYNLVLEEGEWEKWVPESHSVNQQLIIEAAGHYVFMNEEFQELKHKVGDCAKLDKEIRGHLKEKLFRLYGK